MNKIEDKWPKNNFSLKTTFSHGKWTVVLSGGFQSIQDYVAKVDEISNRYSTTPIIA